MKNKTAIIPDARPAIIFGSKVRNFTDDREGTVLAVQTPPAGALGVGFDVLVSWNDGSQSWHDAGDLEFP